MHFLATFVMCVVDFTFYFLTASKVFSVIIVGSDLSIECKESLFIVLMLQM